MRLKQKLARLDPPPKAQPGQARGQTLQRLRDQLARLDQKEERRRRRRKKERVDQEGRSRALPGERTETPYGEVHLVEGYLEPHHCHGRAPIAKALAASAERLGQLALDPRLEGVELERALFLDTETTGLAGGTGTVPFLIGVGSFEDESLRIQQLFLRDLGQEAPMLHWLRERVEASSCLVTFNGKTFDWPLLRNRYVINRVPAPRVSAHIDLLHCARRVFRPRLGSLRLVELEREVLGMRREDDLASAMIPELYFDYLDGGEVEPMLAVLEHNANDVIALSALVAELVDHFEEVHAEDDPRDHLAYARVAERAGDPSRARAFAEAAVEGGGSSSCTVEACLLAARVARRSRDIDAEEAALIEARAVADDDLLRAEVELALAKLYEHRRKDLRRALEHAAGTAIAEGDEGNDRRVARLERRLARHR